MSYFLQYKDKKKYLYLGLCKTKNIDLMHTNVLSKK